MKVYSAIILIKRDSKGKEISRALFENDEIATLDPERRYLYGIDWVYAGTAGFQESNIYAEHKDIVFDDGFGRQALEKFLNWHRTTM